MWPLKSTVLTLAFLFAAICLAPAQPPQGSKIERIEIQGNHRVSSDEILSYIHSRPGDPFDQDHLQRDLLALYKGGFLEHIEINEKDGDKGKIVTFLVKEKPAIRSIEFVGFNSLESSDIEACFKERKVALGVEGQYGRARLRAAERALSDLLGRKGRQSGKVYTQIEQIPPSSERVRFVLEAKDKAPARR